jgi:hypothetical protein
MKSTEVKELIISSLNSDADPEDITSKLEHEGVSYDFAHGFSNAVLNKIFHAGLKVKSEIEFVRNMNFAFRSIAISGVAAIIVLMISIFLMEGSISIDSFLGLRDNYDESIVCLLTGK